MKIGILGAGITGLSIGKLLADKHDVEIFGEIASIWRNCQNKDNKKELVTIQLAAIVFNSKHNEVLDLFLIK